MHWPDPAQPPADRGGAAEREPVGSYRPDTSGPYHSGSPSGSAGPQPGGPGLSAVPISGPRQEYLDAFEETSRGRGRHASPLPRTEPPAPPEPTGKRRAASRPERTGAPPQAAETAPSVRPHTWGRTVTAMVCAGVVLALTFSVAGEVEESQARGQNAPDSARGGGTEPDDNGAEADAHGGTDGPPGDERPGDEDDAAERVPWEELSYEEAMDTIFELDPELTGSGDLVPVPGADEAAFDNAITELRYLVEVEDGLPLDPEMFAEAVHTTLNDPRGWHNNGERSFTRVSSGNHDFVITLASPGTTHEWCAKANLNTSVDNVSCDSATTERVMINAWRWAQGADTYGDDDIHAYRQMLINHEVGHRIGYDHTICPSEGALAPVMMQQTKYLTTNGVTCVANSWPHPGNG